VHEIINGASSMNLSRSTLQAIGAAALIASLTSAPASAADPQSATAAPTPPQRSIDVAKVNERGAKAFASADADGDGKITPAEFAAAKPPGGPGGAPGPHHGHGGARHGDMGPAGGMQAPTAAERAEFQADLFKALDTNHNGELSEAEFAHLHEAMQTLMRQKMFAKLDTNGDGVLTPDEFPAFPKRVSAMDTDGDGKVTRQEMRAAKQAPPAKPAPANSAGNPQ
jgi:Ca2+-binding EF-hand superfamily protein